MSERFICLDCLIVAGISKHGRCSTCGSMAVAPAEISDAFTKQHSTQFTPAEVLHG